MPIEACLFCGEIRPLGIVFRVCPPCWQAEGDPIGRRAQVSRERGLQAPPGSLLYRGGGNETPSTKCDSAKSKCHI